MTKSVNNRPVNVAGIILAAGMSSRLGRTKQLLPYKGKTILAWVIEAAIKSRLKKAYLVLGHEADEIRRTLNYPDLTFVYNPLYEKGQGYSIKYGIREVDESMDAVMFIMGDQPLLKPQTINKLIEVYAEKGGLIVLPAFQGRQGSPVLFSRPLFLQLEKLSGESGGRVLFEEYADQITRVKLQDPGIYFDVDSEEDYLKLQENAPLP
ncbi:molybdenum cofactor cytidylyltransferase [Thermodesulfobacteriota bacterium]